MFEPDKFNKILEIIENSKKNTKIIAVSKNHDLEVVKYAVKKGVKIFGENRVQEAQIKFKKLLQKDPSIKLHLIGPLQTNKVKQALEIFDIFHTLDREKLLREFSKFPLKTKSKFFFIQVNTGKELSKSGIYPEQVGEFLNLCRSYGIFNVIGLMCIPPINEDPKKHFSLINNLTKDFGLGRPSIGMSSDYLQAIDFNPMYIRLGTLLFGNRNER